MSQSSHLYDCCRRRHRPCCVPPLCSHILNITVTIVGKVLASVTSFSVFLSLSFLPAGTEASPGCRTSSSPNFSLPSFLHSFSFLPPSSIPFVPLLPPVLFSFVHSSFVAFSLPSFHLSFLLSSVSSSLVSPLRDCTSANCHFVSFAACSEC